MSDTIFIRCGNCKSVMIGSLYDVKRDSVSYSFRCDLCGTRIIMQFVGGEKDELDG